MGYETANTMTCYNIDITGNEYIQLGENKWVKFDDNGFYTYLEVVRIAGLELLDVTITPTEFEGDVVSRNVEPWQYKLVEKLTKRRFKPDITGSYGGRFKTLKGIVTMPEYTKCEKIIEDVPEYPTVVSIGNCE